jgi:aspartyl-tRNA(Asn)/glutamyl-tRNA(Gln) amidotransferase subunit C
MTLTEDDVRRLARLARIEIDEAETKAVQAKLQSIFGLIDALQAIPTEGVEPMAHAQDVTLALREDRVTETDQRAHFQAVAPAVESGLYLVPKVLE